MPRSAATSSAEASPRRRTAYSTARRPAGTAAARPGVVDRRAGRRRVVDPSVGKQQVAVAELVPLVAGHERRLVGGHQHFAPRHRLQHRQVGGIWLVPAGEQAVDRAHPASRCDDDVGPTRTGVCGAVGIGDGLERPHHGGADGDDVPAGAVRGVHELGGGARHAVALGVGTLSSFERRHARVQDDRGDDDAAADQAGDDLGGERPRRARHLGAPRLGGEHRLVGGERPVARDVRVADRPTVGRHRLGQVDAVGGDRQPQAGATPGPAAAGGRSPRHRAGAP